MQKEIEKVCMQYKEKYLKVDMARISVKTDISSHLIETKKMKWANDKL